MREKSRAEKKIDDKIAHCVEAVLSWLMDAYPDSGIAFVEIGTDINGFTSAQEMHGRVATPRGVPLISFRDAVMPLLLGSGAATGADAGETSAEDDSASVLPNMRRETEKARAFGRGRGSIACSKELPYRCNSFEDCEAVRTRETWSEAFLCDQDDIGSCPRFVPHCYATIWTVDGVHMGRFGHSLVTDLIAAAIQDAALVRSGAGPGGALSGALSNFPNELADRSCSAWRCTCQGMSDAFGVAHNVAWGSAAESAQGWWLASACKTAPLAANVPIVWSATERDNIADMASTLVFLSTTARYEIHISDAFSLYSPPDEHIRTKSGLVSFATHLTAGPEVWSLKPCYAIEAHSNDAVEGGCSSSSFSYVEDRLDKAGWVAASDAGGASISFSLFIDSSAQGPNGLPLHPDAALAVSLGFLRSFEGVGRFAVLCEGFNNEGTDAEVVLEIDALWAQRISVYAEDVVCRLPPGQRSVTVRVTALPRLPGRIGPNKVKLLAVAVSVQRERGASPPTRRDHLIFDLESEDADVRKSQGP